LNIGKSFIQAQVLHHNKRDLKVVTQVMEAQQVMVEQANTVESVEALLHTEAAALTKIAVVVEPANTVQVLLLTEAVQTKTAVQVLMAALDKVQLRTRHTLHTDKKTARLQAWAAINTQVLNHRLQSLSGAHKR
jgi:hypothetical protein